MVSLREAAPGKDVSRRKATPTFPAITLESAHKPPQAIFRYVQENQIREHSKQLGIEERSFN
jgi:hypothetical protein